MKLIDHDPGDHDHRLAAVIWEGEHGYWWLVSEPTCIAVYHGQTLGYSGEDLILYDIEYSDCLGRVYRPWDEALTNPEPIILEVLL